MEASKKHLTAPRGLLPGPGSPRNDAARSSSTRGKTHCPLQQRLCCSMLPFSYTPKQGADSGKPPCALRDPHHALLHLRGLALSQPGPNLESTRTTCTQTPNTLYTRDIPRKKHLIHPLNNSDNSVLSPIYMFQTRYRCYENIANIQKYIHLKKNRNQHINYLQYTSCEMARTK